MSIRRALSLGLGLIALALLVWALWPATPPPPAPAAPPEAPAASRHGRTYKSGARTSLPRRASPAPSAPSPSPETAGEAASRPSTPPSQAQVANDPVEAGEPAPSGPVDRREHPPADAEQVRAAIMDRMEDVSEDISSCLGAWMALDPDLEGQVNIGFQLNADGLEDAYVLDHSDVPLGPLSCFAAAVGEVDWAGVTADPLEVTFPFTFNSEASSAE